MEADPWVLIKKYAYPLTIIAIGFFVYFNTFFNGFVWDDNSYIIGNVQIHSFNLPLFFGKNLFNTVGQYRPIPVLYFFSLYTMFGNMAFFYHIFSVSLHISNTLLLFWFFKQFFGKKTSLIASLAFLVHPMQVESVSYISAVASLLTVLFGLLHCGFVGMCI
jgi:hypothetical protein